MDGEAARVDATRAGRGERQDAARNRAVLLAAAERLFAERGVDTVTTDDVATAAGVGKGTLFRRFGDKSGLVAAVLAERERQFLADVTAGPPPLGPGAPPAERLVAFVRAHVARLARDLDVARVAETASPGARFRSAGHVARHRHVVALLTAAGAPEPDAEYGADVLLAALSAELVARQRERGLSWAAVGAGAVALAAALAPAPALSGALGAASGCARVQ